MTTQQSKQEVKLSSGKVVEQEQKMVLYISVSGNYRNVDLALSINVCGKK